jgi:hypothetical protein
MMSAVSRASSSRPCGMHRCVERCCPSTRQTRRSDSSSLDRTCSMQARRKAGLRSFADAVLRVPRRPLSRSACPGSDRPPRGAAGHSQGVQFINPLTFQPDHSVGAGQSVIELSTTFHRDCGLTCCGGTPCPFPSGKHQAHSLRRLSPVQPNPDGAFSCRPASMRH